MRELTMQLYWKPAFNWIALRLLGSHSALRLRVAELQGPGVGPQPSPTFGFYPRRQIKRRTSDWVADQHLGLALRPCPWAARGRPMGGPWAAHGRPMGGPWAAHGRPSEKQTVTYQVG